MHRSRRFKGLQGLLCLVFLFATVGCSLSYEWLRNLQVERALQRQDYPRALSLLQDTIKEQPDSARALEAARRGARLAQLEAKNYPLAISFLQAIVLSSLNSDERKSAALNIAQIDYDNLQDYAQAVVEFEKLLRMQPTPDEAFQTRLNLAKSHLRLNNIDQALAEIDVLVGQKHKPEQIFEAKVLQANTLVAARRMAEAASLWENILKDFPVKAKKESIGLNLAVCYEEMKDFNRAISVLEQLRPGYTRPEFLDVRIQRLRERAHNQPGAQGLKR